MKNVVFMMDIDIGGEGRWSSTRSTPYKYSIDSWRKWCDKNDCELFVLNDLILPNDEMAVCWQRWYIFDLLEANGIEYDQILSVDADTIVHPDTPNFFEMTNHNFTVVDFDGSWDWVLRSLESYSKYVFDGKMIDWWKYFDSGFWIVNKKHKEFAKSMTDFYHNNKDLLIEMENKFHLGTEQTPLNFMIQTSGYEMTFLPYEFNMNDMNRKEILHDDLLFTKIGWVYQFNCIPNNKENSLTNYWMEKTHKELYNEIN